MFFNFFQPFFSKSKVHLVYLYAKHHSFVWCTFYVRNLQAQKNPYLFHAFSPWCLMISLPSPLPRQSTEAERDESAAVPWSTPSWWWKRKGVRTQNPLETFRCRNSCSLPRCRVFLFWGFCFDTWQQLILMMFWSKFDVLKIDIYRSNEFLFLHETPIYWIYEGILTYYIDTNILSQFFK